METCCGFKLCVWTRIVLACFLLLHNGEAQESILTFSPAILTISPSQDEVGEPLTITCSTMYDRVISMHLKRRPTLSTTETWLASASDYVNNGTARLEAYGAALGGTAGGSIAEKQIDFTIPRANCSDAMEYICNTVLFAYDAWDGDAYPEAEAVLNLTAEVTPWLATLTLQSLSPPCSHIEGGFCVGDHAVLTCNAPVGSVNNDTRIEFVWQYEADAVEYEADPVEYKADPVEYEVDDFGTWVTYDRPEDIVTDPLPTPLSDPCQSQTMISRLYRRVTIEDSQRRYRCSIRRNYKNYHALAGIATIPAVVDPGVRSTSLPNPSQGHELKPTLTFSPATLTTSPCQNNVGEQLTITCTITGTPTGICLLRRPASYASETWLAYAWDTVNTGTAELAYGAATLGATAGGSIAEKRISITMPRANCSDAMEYICNATLREIDGTLLTDTRSVLNLTGEVTPWLATLTLQAVNPHCSDMDGSFCVGDTAALTCNACVGSVNSDTRIEFVWQYQADAVEYEADDFGSWVTYDRPEDIVTEPLTTPLSDPCQSQTMISRLYRSVTMEDSQRLFRCYIKRNDMAYQDLAGEVRIPTVVDPGVRSPRLPNLSQAEGDHRSCTRQSIGTAVLVTAAAFTTLIIVVATIITVILWRRRWILPCAKRGSPAVRRYQRGGTILSAPGLAGWKSILQNLAAPTTSYQKMSNELILAVPTPPEYSSLAPTDAGIGLPCKNSQASLNTDAPECVDPSELPAQSNMSV